MTDREMDELAHAMFIDIFKSYIEDGTVPIAGKSAEEIINDFFVTIESEWLTPEAEGSELYASIDYRSTILDRASSEAEHGNPFIAITLYATWLEHYINKVLYLMLTRRGLTSKAITLLLRELRIPTKAVALWEIAELRPLADDHIKLMEQILNFRNLFVHYKWTSATESEIDRRDTKLRDLVARMPELINELHQVEADQIWLGRRDELLWTLDRLHREKEEVDGTFSDYLKSNNNQPENQ